MERSDLFLSKILTWIIYRALVSLIFPFVPVRSMFAQKSSAPNMATRSACVQPRVPSSPSIIQVGGYEEKNGNPLGCKIIKDLKVERNNSYVQRSEGSLCLDAIAVSRAPVRKCSPSPLRSPVMPMWCTRKSRPKDGPRLDAGVGLAGTGQAAAAVEVAVADHEVRVTLELVKGV